MMYWYDYTWEELGELIGKVKGVILPIGSCEQHSLHLPVGMDSFAAIKLAEKVAESLKGEILILPPIWYGLSIHHMKFPGTITLSSETLVGLITDIARSLKHHGVKKLIILNGHGGNVTPIAIALRKIRDEIGLETALVNPWELASEDIQKIIESKVWGHACEFETSVALAIIPEKVRKDKIKKPNLKEQRAKYMNLWDRPRIIWAWNTDDFTDTGAIGDPTKASREKGEKILEIMFKRTLEFVKSFINA